MKTIQTFILFILLIAVNSYPQDSFVSGVDVTQGISTSSLNLEGLTTASTNEGVQDEGNLSSTAEQGSLDVNSIWTNKAEETRTLESENNDTNSMSNIDSSAPPKDEEVFTIPADSSASTFDSSATMLDSSQSTLDSSRSALDLAALPLNSSGQVLNSTASTLDSSASTLDSSPSSASELDSTTSTATTFDLSRSLFVSSASTLDSSAPELNLTASISDPTASTLDSSVSTLDSSTPMLDLTLSTLDSSASTMDLTTSTMDLSRSMLDSTASKLDSSRTMLDSSASTLESSQSMLSSSASNFDSTLDLTAPTNDSTLDSSTRMLDSSASTLDLSRTMLDSSASTLKSSESIAPENTIEPLNASSSSQEILKESTTESALCLCDCDTGSILSSTALKCEQSSTESNALQMDTKGDKEILNSDDSANREKSTAEMYSLKGLRVWTVEEDVVSGIGSTSHTEVSVGLKEENAKGTTIGPSETVDRATTGSSVAKSEIDVTTVSEEGAEIKTTAVTESPELAMISKGISVLDETTNVSIPSDISEGLAAETSVPITDLEIKHPVAPGVTNALELTEETEGTPSTQKATEPNTVPVSQQATQAITALAIEVNQVPNAATVSETVSGTYTTTLSNLAPESQTPEVIESNQAPIDPSTTRPPLAIPSSIPNPCTEVGNFSNPSNCRLYYTCTGNASNLIRQEGECPPTFAFCPILRRCTRDISTCAEDGPICLKSGSIADPNNTSAYYWCLSNRLGGFHKYHVQCSSGEIFNATFGRCLSDGPLISLRKPSKGHSHDRDVVKAEWKMLKKAIKAKSKEEKIRQKMEAKAKAHAEKLAAKEQKKQKGPPKRDDDDDDDDDDEDDD